jgi:hypothetical protein
MIDISACVILVVCLLLLGGAAGALHYCWVAGAIDSQAFACIAIYWLMAAGSAWLVESTWPLWSALPMFVLCAGLGVAARRKQ